MLILTGKDDSRSKENKLRPESLGPHFFCMGEILAPSLFFWDISVLDTYNEQTSDVFGRIVVDICLNALFL